MASVLTALAVVFVSGLAILTAGMLVGQMFIEPGRGP